jgi:RNA-binding protein NOB1
VQFAKKTGDYAVLSHADICILALTHSLHVHEKALSESHPEHASFTDAAPTSSDILSATPNDVKSAENDAAEENGENARDSQADENSEAEAIADPSGVVEDEADGDVQVPPTSPSDTLLDAHGENDEDEEREPLDIELQRVEDTTEDTTENRQPSTSSETGPSDQPLHEDPSDEDDGEGEWITPQNVALHKSRALELLPSDGGTGKKGRRRREENELVLAGCMTGDFAVQNVLLQMGLTLVGTEGKRIQKVKSWVLRCHACFK